MTTTRHSHKASPAAPKGRGKKPFSIANAIKPSRAKVTLPRMPGNIDDSPTTETVVQLENLLTREREALLRQQQKVIQLAERLNRARIRAARCGQLTG